MAVAEASISGSRSSRAARRLTKVVFAWRKVGGRSARLRPRAMFSSAIAPNAVLALEIALESSSLRSDTAVPSRLGADQEAREEPFVGGQFAEERPGAVEADAEVLEGVVAVLPAPGVPGRVAADELAEAAANRRREGVEELVDVDRGGGRGEAQSRVVVQRRIAVGAGADRDVVVGDAGERGRTDDRRGALVQLLFDADHDLGEVVVGQLDALDRADRLAADQDLVVGNELAGVLEEEVVAVLAVAAEDDDAERDHRNRQHRDRRDSRGGHPPALRRALVLA